jgi:hypothetical protein
VDLASLDVDDCSCCVQEWSSNHDGRILLIPMSMTKKSVGT